MINNKRSLWLMLFFCLAAASDLRAQSAQFNFSLGAHSVSGWTNVVGDPSVGVISVTSSSGITVSSIGTTHWVPYGSGSAYDGVGEDSAGFFPAAVMFNHWYQYGNTAEYNAAVPQLLISGLSPDSSYTIAMAGSSTSSLISNPVQYTVSGYNVYPSQDVNNHNNVHNGATFYNVVPDTGGKVRIYVNTLSTTDIADINGLTITGGATSPLPKDSITSPLNGSVLSEDGNINITATASIATGTISMVQFYDDTTLIGTVTSAPYNMTWYNPDPGNYQLIAKATDYLGRTVNYSIRVTIASLNYFWSTTGNIATGGDSAFLGTVDSNHLAFRTKDLERMVITAIGNVGIGTDSPTAQLHTMGSVRLAGLTADSTHNRILVSDSSGNLYYRNLSSSDALNAGPGLGQTSTGIALGDSIAGPGPHSFTSNRYQYLNGFQYSVGGSVNDPANHPVFRMYNNGDLAAGTTMDQSVNTYDQQGMRYYSKLGYLQIGASDRLDTTQSAIVYGHWPSSGIILNSDDSNSIHGKFMNSVVGAYQTTVDTAVWCENCLIATNNSHFYSTMGVVNDLTISGYGLQISAPIVASFFGGASNSITKPCAEIIMDGYRNSTADTSYGSFTQGAVNTVGGLDQLTVGLGLVNRTPIGTVLGNYNVDFSSLSWTGLKGPDVAGIGGYPLFALGNASTGLGTIHSNAVTVLYNGRTQINTTGLSNTLTQAQVTPQAALDVVSTNTGVLLPRLTTSQRNAIVSGDLQNGLLLYNTDSSAFQYYNGSAWGSLGSGNGSTNRWLFANGTYYDSTDNIAIGTNNTQGYKLAVNGTAIFTKVRVKPTGSWPDYVFKKSFVLPGLDEVENYIREHHHLPGIASEQEVQGGYDIGEQQAAVLKKVEELTLYLIRENKTLTAQNKQISEQARQVSEQNKQLLEQNARLEAQQKEIDELKAMIQANKK